MQIRKRSRVRGRSQQPAPEERTAPSGGTGRRVSHLDWTGESHHVQTSAPLPPGSRRWFLVNEAYETLIDPGSRQSYDFSLQWAEPQVTVRVEPMVAQA